jgi:uncharacterized protein YlaI
MIKMPIVDCYKFNYPMEKSYRGDFDKNKLKQNDNKMKCIFCESIHISIIEHEIIETKFKTRNIYTYECMECHEKWSDIKIDYKNEENKKMKTDSLDAMTHSLHALKSNYKTDLQRKVDAIKKAQEIKRKRIKSEADKWKKRLNELVKYMEVIEKPISCWNRIFKYYIDKNGIYFKLSGKSYLNYGNNSICKEYPILYQKLFPKITKKINKLYESIPIELPKYCAQCGCEQR